MPFLYSYNAASNTARELSASLGYRRIRHDNSRFRGSPRKTVINYGSSDLPAPIQQCRVINSPEAVARCSNKRTFFQAMDIPNGPRIVPFTTEIATVRQWLLDNKAVVARTILQGHSGDGIHVMGRDYPEDNIVDAPLYTQYVKKASEWRVHIVNGHVIDVAKKILRSDMDPDHVNWMIRSHNNGFIYARNNIVVPPDVTTQALRAMEVAGLDFGGVDVIYNDHYGEAYVLEINSAPGMEGQTITNYTEALRAMVEGSN